MSKWIRRFWPALFSLAILYAPDDLATVTGVVTDAASAVMPGVKVTIRNTDTNISRTMETNQEGTFTELSALGAGRSAEALQLAIAPNSAPRNAIHKLTLILWRCDSCPVEFFNLFIRPGGEHVGCVRDYCPSRTAIRSTAA